MTNFYSNNKADHPVSRATTNMSNTSQHLAYCPLFVRHFLLRALLIIYTGSNNNNTYGHFYWYFIKQNSNISVKAKDLL